MIGQRVLLERIQGQIERNKFPRFSILIGEKGSGRKTLANEISKMMGISMYTSFNIGVDDIRIIIGNSYSIATPLIYVIPDCDNMSSAAANALLKVTEEPPQNAYFILTCESIDNLLSTIKSRGVTYMLEPYTYEDKCDYLHTHNNLTEEEETFVLNVASNLGEVAELAKLNIAEFQDYVNLVIDNIAEVSDSNSFKIADKIALKDDSDKYDLRLFWRAFNTICVDRMMNSDDPLKYANAVAITGDALQELHIRGINKTMLIDRWILDIREAWL